MFEGQDFELGKKGEGRGIRFRLCDEPDCPFLHLEDFFGAFLGCARVDGEALEEVGMN